jgi:tetratricopeptide (TPR) repeat protein
VFSQETYRPGTSYADRMRLLSLTADKSNLRNEPVPTSGESVSTYRLQHQSPPRAVHAFTKGHKRLLKGDWLGAALELEKAIEIDPLFFDAHNDLGFANERQENYTVAAKEFNTLIQIDPHDHLGYLNLGIVYYNTHNWSRSEQMARRALSLAPVNTRASLLLGMSLLAEEKKTPEARRKLEFASGEFAEARSALLNWDSLQPHTP